MNKAFTLIELLVVISIIGILAALAVFSFTSSQKQARDIKRKSDLSQYRNALESYANKNDGLYVISANASAVTGTLCSGLVSSGFLGSTDICPGDPRFDQTDPMSNPQYQYQTDSSGTKYALWAALENGGKNWLVCSNGTSLAKSGNVSISDCP